MKRPSGQAYAWLGWRAGTLPLPIPQRKCPRPPAWDPVELAGHLRPQWILWGFDPVLSVITVVSDRETEHCGGRASTLPQVITWKP